MTIKFNSIKKGRKKVLLVVQEITHQKKIRITNDIKLNGQNKGKKEKKRHKYIQLF